MRTFYALLVALTATACAQESAKMEYIEKNYNVPAEQSTFQHVYGNPKEAQNILLVFTSLTCPVCADFHLKGLQELLNKTERKDLAIILRDYPADSLSLKASAVVWAFSPHAQGPESGAILKRLFAHKDMWVGLPEGNALAEVKNQAREALTSSTVSAAPAAPPALSLSPQHAQEKKIIEEATGRQSLLEAIYAKRQLDKAGLDLTEVPTAWLALKKGGRIVRLERISNPPEVQPILDLVHAPR